MFCPNCGNGVSSENYCPNCGVELVYVDNHVLIKEYYLEVKDVHDNMDNFLSASKNSLNTLKDYVDSANLLLEFNNDFSLIDEFLSNLNYAKTSMINFRNTIAETLDDESRIEYLRSMNYIFGDVDSKINECLSLIEDYLDYINIFTKKIEYYDSKSDYEDSDIISVEEYHSRIDEMISNMNRLYELFDTQIKQQEIYEELRNDVEERESFKENINESLNSVNDFEKTLDEYLQPKKLKELKKFDNQYGDIEDKMIECKTKISETRNILFKCLDMINNIEKPKIDKNIKLNNKRVIDL